MWNVAVVMGSTLSQPRIPQGCTRTIMFTSLSLIGIGLLHLSALLAAQQVPIDWEGWKANKQSWADSPAAVVLSPLQDLHVLSSEQFATLGHPAFPKYNVRIKKSTDFCDGGVKCVVVLPFIRLDN